jgi:hypothetical protein
VSEINEHQIQKGSKKDQKWFEKIFRADATAQENQAVAWGGPIVGADHFTNISSFSSSS